MINVKTRLLFYQVIIKTLFYIIIVKTSYEIFLKNYYFIFISQFERFFRINFIFSHIAISLTFKITINFKLLKKKFIKRKMLKSNILIINIIIIINVFFNFLTFNLSFKFYIKKIINNYKDIFYYRLQKFYIFSKLTYLTL